MYVALLAEGGGYDYADVILALRENAGTGAKVVQIAGRDVFIPETADDIFALVVALEDAGYITYVQTDGTTYYPWMARVKLNSVYITEKWLPRRVQEFVWASPNPIVLPPDEKTTPLFLDIEPERTRKILHASTQAWRIYDPHPPILNEYLLGGEGGVG
jgi:hypothetical protein